MPGVTAKVTVSMVQRWECLMTPRLAQMLAISSSGRPPRKAIDLPAMTSGVSDSVVSKRR